MGFEITKVYKQEVPSLRFIGKKYGNKDRVDGMFGKYWGDWFQNGWFDIVKKQFDGDLKNLYDDSDSCFGLMRGEGETFEYWIGLFLPEGTNIPDGYEHHDFTKSTLGVCWVYGNEGEVFGHEWECMKKLEKEFNKPMTGWCFERYVGSRFEPDANGKVTLDICFYFE